jgi:hypothetical protein
MSTHFILQISFIKCIFTNAFPVFKNSRDGKNISLVLFLPLKLWKRLPKIYKSVCGFFFENPFGYDQPFNATHRHLHQIYLTL